MFPVILKLGPITIYSYGVMIAFAFFVSTILCLKESKISNIKKELILDLSVPVMISGIIGARLMHILLNLKEYILSPLEIVKIYRGGLMLYGGIAGGILCSLIYLRKKRQPVLKVLDLVSPYVALAQVWGRIGCFLNGCCYGRESLRFGLYFPLHNKILLPTQIYSSLGNLLIFFILKSTYRRKRFDGQVILLYFILYPLKRFLIEFLRADTQALMFRLSLFQLLSFIILITSVIIYFRRWKRLASV